MANNKHLAEDSKNTQFSPTNQPENRGRKPSVLRFVRGSDVMSITDIRKIIGSLIWEYDSEELAELLKTVNVKVKDENGKTKVIKKLKDPIPMGVNLVLGALNADLKSKSITNFERLMDRSYGKPTQTLDIKPTNLFTAMTPEERDKRIEELLKKSEPKKSAKKS
jgi:hypothetical protein